MHSTTLYFIKIWYSLAKTTYLHLNIVIGTNYTKFLLTDVNFDITKDDYIALDYHNDVESNK